VSGASSGRLPSTVVQESRAPWPGLMVTVPAGAADVGGVSAASCAAPQAGSSTETTATRAAETTGDECLTRDETWQRLCRLPRIAVRRSIRGHRPGRHG